MAKHLFISISKVTFVVLALLILKLVIGEKTGIPTKGMRGLEGVQELDWLVVGTSHIDTGYHTRWLTQQSQQRIYTLWYAGMNPMELELILDEILAKVKVKNLVIDVIPAGYSSPPNIWEVGSFLGHPPGTERKTLFTLSRALS